VKISQPVAETSAKWESYSKFRLGGMLSKVPKHIRAAGAPSMLQFTPGYPPFVAVAVGAKCAQQVTSDLAGLRTLAQCSPRLLC